MYSHTLPLTSHTATHSQRSAGTLPLAMADMGRCSTVCRVKGNDETKAFLCSLGFVPGAEVRVVSRMGDNLIVDIKGSRVGIGNGMALRIMVD